MGKPISLAMLALTGLLAACASKQELVQNKEDLLAAAGFSVLPATTPERQQQMASLPPNHFLSRTQGGKLVYLYADPLVCNCLYVGDQGAYGRYRQEVFQRRIADEQRLTAESYENAQWDWGAWGPGWWR
ncbi:MAG TPA: hypothetical protein VM689_04995 [Aliidongia sp.]|nr:hypothetical protein [Aliidongia sp.]